MIAAIALAAALNCSNNDASQLELNECAAVSFRRAERAETAAYAQALDGTHGDRSAREQLVVAEHAWRHAREAACGFVAAMYAEGSIEPLEEFNCRAFSATARTHFLHRSKKWSGNSLPSTDTTTAEMVRVYGLLELLLTPNDRDALAHSQEVWLNYVRVACAPSAARCRDFLTRRRTDELKQSWLGDPFW